MDDTLLINNQAMNDPDESQIPFDYLRLLHLKQLKSLDLFTSGFSGQTPNEIF